MSLDTVMSPHLCIYVCPSPQYMNTCMCIYPLFMCTLYPQKLCAQSCKANYWVNKDTISIPLISVMLWTASTRQSCLISQFYMLLSLLPLNQGFTSVQKRLNFSINPRKLDILPIFSEPKPPPRRYIAMLFHEINHHLPPPPLNTYHFGISISIYITVYTVYIHENILINTVELPYGPKKDKISIIPQ